MGNFWIIMTLVGLVVSVAGLVVINTLIERSNPDDEDHSDWGI